MGRNMYFVDEYGAPPSIKCAACGAQTDSSLNELDIEEPGVTLRNGVLAYRTYCDACEAPMRVKFEIKWKLKSVERRGGQ